MKKLKKLALFGGIAAALFYMLVLALDGNVVGAAVFMIPISLFVFVFYLGKRQTASKRAKSYDWYRQAYPDAIRNGRVTCHSCGSDRVYTKNVMNHTYLRDHSCGQCGDTLYYSPEGMRKS